MIESGDRRLLATAATATSSSFVVLLSGRTLSLNLDPSPIFYVLGRRYDSWRGSLAGTEFFFGLAARYRSAVGLSPRETNRQRLFTELP